MDISTLTPEEAYLEGLKDAYKLYARELPQGQYDRFNEYSFGRNLKARMEEAGIDWKEYRKEARRQYR